MSLPQKAWEFPVIRTGYSQTSGISYNSETMENRVRTMTSQKVKSRSTIRYSDITLLSWSNTLATTTSYLQTMKGVPDTCSLTDPNKLNVVINQGKTIVPTFSSELYWIRFIQGYEALYASITACAVYALLLLCILLLWLQNFFYSQRRRNCSILYKLNIIKEFYSSC